MKYLPFLLFLFCYYCVFAQKDSVVSFDEKGKPKEYAIFRNRYWLQKKLKYDYVHNWNPETQVRKEDTIARWQFIYPKNLKRTVGTIDTLYISQKTNAAPAITTLWQKDSITEICTSNASNNYSIVKRFPDDWEYVENNTDHFISQKYFHKGRYDSICTEYNKKTKEKTVFQLFGQQGKKWTFSNYKNDTLVKMTEIDDNIPFWRFVEYYPNGQKKQEITAHKDSIPTLHTWAQNDKKYKTEQTWRYNMFGEEVVAVDSHKPFLLRLFPYYSGYYIKFFPLKKTQEIEYDDWGFDKMEDDFEIDDEGEWGFGVETQETTKDTVFADKNIKKKKTYKITYPLFKIYHFWQGMCKDKTLCMYQNGKIQQDDTYKDFSSEVPTYSPFDLLVIKPLTKRKTKSVIPYIPLDTDDYSLYSRVDNITPENLSGSVQSRVYSLKWLFEERYKMRALAGMDKPLPFLLQGHIMGWGNSELHADLLKINYNVEAIYTGCTGEDTPESWISTVKDIKLSTEHPQNKENYSCQYWQGIDNAYNCYTELQAHFLEDKWAALCAKDSTLPKFMFQRVRLYYKENKLQKVVFLEGIYDENDMLKKVKIIRKPKDKVKKALKKLLFQMPCYIIPQEGRQRKIILSYLIRY